MARLPLEGIRILEPGAWVAVPMAIKYLADMGAEVIKVESFQHLTNRLIAYPDNTAGKEPWNQSGYYQEYNRNKRAIAVDLTKPEGADLFKKLALSSDVVAENYSPRVMKNLGLDYESLRAIKPDIIMLSSTGYGQYGPWRDYGAFGTSLEATSGLSHLTGYPDLGPGRSMVAYTDGPAGVMGAFAILYALHYRRRTGRGMWIDLSQYENQINFFGHVMMDSFMNGRVPGRMGNRDTSMAPHGAYRCAGSDNWIAIAVGSDAEFTALCNIMGRPELANDPRFADVLSRYDHQDELDPIIEAWTRPQDHIELFHRLQAAGIAAGPVLNNKELLLDPHLKARGFWEMITASPRAENCGTRPAFGMAWKNSKTPGKIRKGAPTMGEDNFAVLNGILGLSPEEVRRLEDERIIADRYLGGQVAVATPPLAVYKELGRLEAYEPNYKEVLGIA